jgi:hypothetical protein
MIFGGIMIDVTDFVMDNANGTDPLRFDQMIDWCASNIGAIKQMAGGIHIGDGWLASLKRVRGRGGLRFCFEFENELDELQFKIVWSLSTSQISAQELSANGVKHT